MAYSTEHAMNEAAYMVRRGARKVGGGMARAVLKLLTSVGAGMAGIAGSATALYTTGVVGMIGGVALQGYLNHKDYEHSKEQLASMYSKEIGAFLGKDPRSVGVKDLENLGNALPSVRKHIEKERLTRDIRTGSWLGAAVLGIAAAGVAMTVLAGSAGVLPLAGLAAVTTVYVVRPVVRQMAQKYYKVDQPTTIDLVKSLEWKRTLNQQVTRSQVMEVYVSASPKLSALIEKQHGAPYTSLSAMQQEKIMVQYGQSMRLDDVTQAINENRLNPRELTFRVHRQESTAYPDPSYKEQLDKSVNKVKTRVHNVKQNVQQKGQQLVTSARNFIGGGNKAEERGDTLEAPQASQHTSDNSTKWRDYHASREQSAMTNQGQGV